MSYPPPPNARVMHVRTKVSMRRARCKLKARDTTVHADARHAANACYNTARANTSHVSRPTHWTHNHCCAREC